MTEQVVRIAARGDGVTASGRHVPFGVPGDTLLDDGTIALVLITSNRHAVTFPNAVDANSSMSMTMPTAITLSRGW